MFIEVDIQPYHEVKTRNMLTKKRKFMTTKSALSKSICKEKERELICLHVYSLEKENRMLLFMIMSFTVCYGPRGFSGLG